MAKKFNQWLDEFVENGADPKDVTNWSEKAGGGPVPALQWDNSMTMTDEIMEKLVNRELELYWSQNRYLYVSNYTEDEGLESEYSIYSFGEAPSIDTYSDRIYINTIEFKKQWGRYFFNDRYFNQYQALPIIEVIGGQVSGSTLTVRLDNDYMKEKFNNNWVSAIHFFVTNGGIFSNLMCYFRAYGANQVYYISPLSGTTYYEVVANIPDFSLEAPDLVFTVEFKDIADHIEVSYPSLPGRGTQYTLTVGDKGDLSIDKALNILTARILDINQFGILSMRAGDGKTSVTFTTPVFNNSYYSIVLTPTGDKEFGTIEVNITENAVGGQQTINLTAGEILTQDQLFAIEEKRVKAVAGDIDLLLSQWDEENDYPILTSTVYDNKYLQVTFSENEMAEDATARTYSVVVEVVSVGGMQEPTFNFEVSSLSTSSSGELSADNPIIQWLQALAEEGVETASAKVNIYEASEDGGIGRYILLTLAQAEISSRGEVTFSATIGANGVRSYTLHINPYLASQWYYHFNVDTIVELPE